MLSCGLTGSCSYQAAMTGEEAWGKYFCLYLTPPSLIIQPLIQFALKYLQNTAFISNQGANRYHIKLSPEPINTLSMVFFFYILGGKSLKYVGAQIIVVSNNCVRKNESRVHMTV